jgi:hypothetical protein
MATTHGLPAQGVATVDIGFAAVRYDGFLPSSAGSVSPAFRLERPGVLVAGRGSYLRFESGRHSLQGNLAFSAFTRPLGRVRVELSGDGGMSRYAQFAGFSHLLVGPRLHLAGRREGAWIGATFGAAALGDVRRPVTAFTSGSWAERFGATWLLTATLTHVGDSVYTDVEGTAHLRRGPVTFDGLLGVRGWSRGGGHGVYGEASAALRLRAWIALILSGGRYPTDPIRGSVSGRYASLSLRFAAPPRVGTPDRPPPPRVAPQWHSPAGGSDPAPLTLEVLRCDECDGPVIVLHAGDALRVEVSGDFTDWEPMPLTMTAPATWSLQLHLPPGTYRFNIRIDGGAWVVPAGVTRQVDEFGGHVGLLTIP